MVKLHKICPYNFKKKFNPLKLIHKLEILKIMAINI